MNLEQTLTAQYSLNGTSTTHIFARLHTLVESCSAGVPDDMGLNTDASLFARVVIIVHFENNRLNLEGLQRTECLKWSQMG